MVILIFIFAMVVISVALMLCATVLRSKSLSTLNLFIWSGITFLVAPWSTLSSVPPVDSDARLEWDAALVWAAFFAFAVLTLIYCSIAVRMANKPPKSRRRRRRSSQDEKPAPDPAGTDTRRSRRPRSSKMSAQNI